MSGQLQRPSCSVIFSFLTFAYESGLKYQKKGIFSSKEATNYEANCSLAVPGFHNIMKTYRWDESPKIYFMSKHWMYLLFFPILQKTGKTDISNKYNAKCWKSSCYISLHFSFWFRTVSKSRIDTTIFENGVWRYFFVFLMISLLIFKFWLIFHTSLTDVGNVEIESAN